MGSEGMHHKKRKDGGIQIGMYKGEKYIADGYDFDQECGEIVEMFTSGTTYDRNDSVAGDMYCLE